MDSDRYTRRTSAETKKVWNLDAITALVKKELTENLEFYNKPLPKPTTVSSSTQPAWKDDSEEYKPKESASAQGIWERGNKILHLHSQRGR